MNIKQQRKTEYGCDETIQDMKILFRLANAAFGTEWITKQQIYSLVDQEEDLFSWMNLNERRGQTMIGKALSHYNEQVLGGIMLKTVGGKNIRRYRFSKANVMSGITTSETMSGEQPKEDDLGSRLDELKAELKAEFEKQIFEEVFVISGKLDELSTKLEEIEEQLSADRLFVDGELKELKSRIFPVLKSVLKSIEALEKKINDGR